MSKTSAIIPGQPNAEAIEIHKDHKTLVKMGSPKDGDFDVVSSHLFLMAEDAPEQIRIKWEGGDSTGLDVSGK